MIFLHSWQTTHFNWGMHIIVLVDLTEPVLTGRVKTFKTNKQKNISFLCIGLFCNQYCKWVCKKICKLMVLPYYNIHVGNSNKKDMIVYLIKATRINSPQLGHSKMTCCCSWRYFKTARTWIARQSCIFSHLAGQNWAWHLCQRISSTDDIQHQTLSHWANR